jgi:hypothetical protein
MALNEIIRIIALIGAFFGIYYVISIVSLKKNIIKVIKIFEKNNALTAKTAVSLENLGIIQQNLLERTVKRRDDRIHALKFLMGYQCVITSDNERYYLNKKKMATFRRDGNLIARFIIPPNLDN